MIPHYCYHFSSFGFQLLVQTTQVASTGRSRVAFSCCNSATRAMSSDRRVFSSESSASVAAIKRLISFRSLIIGTSDSLCGTPSRIISFNLIPWENPGASEGFRKLSEIIGNQNVIGGTLASYSAQQAQIF